jgi:tetratricopeptide (TPR) repeat protein
MQSFSKNLIFSLVLLYLSFSSLNTLSQADQQKEQLKSELSQSVDDTAKVRILFRLGNQFIDGPSDSLMYYYSKALLIIEENLLRLENTEDKNDLAELRQFKELELRVFIEFGIEYFFRSDYSKALSYYFKALHIAEELDDKEVISECHSEIGIVYKNQGKYDLALKHNEEALYYAAFVNDSSWTAACYANQGTIYLKKGYYSLALNNYLRALRTFEGLGFERRMGACYLNIGKIYTEQLDLDQALIYYNRALDIANETGDKVSKTDNYLSMGKTYLLQKKYSIARNYLNLALEMFKETGYSHGLDDCYTSIGHTYRMEQRYEEAKGFYQKSLELSTFENDLPGMASSYNDLAQIEYLKKDFAAALDFAGKSLEKARESGNLNALKEAYATLSEISEQLGNNKDALTYYKRYSEIKDTLFSESKYRSIREAEAKFETEKKQQQLTLLAQQNEVQQLKLSRRRNLLFASGLGIVLVLLVSYLLIRQNRIKSQQKAIVLEQRLLRSQMNPHFIFNSLIAIQSYIYKSEPLQAGDFLAKFADLVRFTLDHSRVEFVLLSDELKMLTAYLDLQVLRFDNKFEYTLSVESDTDTEHMEIPPMFAQPFVENAIEHGLRHKQEKGHLVITYTLKNDRHMEILIEDDGVGRDKAKGIEKKKKHRSLAMEITRERLAMLKKKHNDKFTLEVTDIEDESGHCRGTRARITLPVRLI